MMKDINFMLHIKTLLSLGMNYANFQNSTFNDSKDILNLVKGTNR